MAEGWIKLYRSIRKNWIWEDAQKLKWWLDILLQANHQDKKILIGNELVLIERGSFHTSIIKLSERWKVDRKTVKRFLELLQNDNMISLKTSKKGTTISISNYNDFQAISEDKKDNREDNKVPTYAPTVRTTEGTTPSPDKSQISPNKLPTNKNDKELYKNYKNEEEGKEGEEVMFKSTPILFPSEHHRKLYESGISELVYKTWFMNTSIMEDDKTVTVSAYNEFSVNTIQSRYIGELKRAFGDKKFVIKEGSNDN